MITSEFGLFLLRWLHTFAGIIWIGLLYYINFVQGPYMAEADASSKSSAFTKLVPRVLWWFRWSALWTTVLGVIYMAARAHIAGFELDAYWAKILAGAAMGLVMASNVWFVIWPAQKLVIANAQAMAGGASANPAVALRAARGLVASRTNVLLSIPMLFFMGAASHWNFGVREESVRAFLLITGVVIAAIEANALFGKTGPITTIKGVITSGFALTAVFAALVVFVLAA